MENYEKVLQTLIDITHKQIPQYTNYSDADPLMILEKLMTSLYISNQTYGNRYIQSNYTDKNGINIDYKINDLLDINYNEVHPITLDLLIESNKLYTYPIVFTKGSQFTFDGIDFTNFDNDYLNTQNSYITLNLIEGKFISYSTPSSSINNKGELYFTQDVVATDYIRVYVDNIEWDRVDKAQYQTGKKYSLVYKDNSYIIIFAYDYTQTIPNNANIVIEYIVPQLYKTIDSYSSDFSIISPVYDINNNNINKEFTLLSLSNYTCLDANKLDYFKIINKLSLTKNKTISCYDFSNIPQYHNNISISAAYDINSELRNDPKINITSPYLLKIVVAPTQNRYVTDKAKQELLESLRDNGLTNKDLTIQIIDPDYILVNLDIRINSTTTNAQELFDIKNNILSNLKTNFEIGKIPFASTISKDFINSIVLNADNRINYIDIKYLEDINLKATELPILGDINITFTLNYIFVEDDITFDETSASVLDIKRAYENIFFNEINKLQFDTEDSISFREIGSKTYTLSEEVIVNEKRIITLCTYIETKHNYRANFIIN